jgi:hypothetical protein
VVELVEADQTQTRYLRVTTKVCMLIRRLDHVQLAMPPGRDDDARAFYQGLLGIPEVQKPLHLAAREVAGLRMAI